MIIIKKCILNFILLIPFLFFSQKKKDFKIEKISFVQKDSITNLEEYRKGGIVTLENMMKKMSVVLGEINTKELDSISNSISQKELDKFVITYHYKKINDSIIERRQENDNTTGSIFINTKNEKEYYHFPYDKRYDEAFRFPFEKITNLETR